jgi:hypothetical protein
MQRSRQNRKQGKETASREEEAGLTSEEVVLQAALGHELVHQQELPVLHAVPQQPHQVGVRQPPQEVHLRLQEEEKQRQGLA